MSIILASEAIKVLSVIKAELGDAYFQRRFVCITTAGRPYGETPWIKAEQAALRNLGATIEEMDLSNLSAEEVARRVSASEAMFVHGGNTFYLLQEMQRVRFKEHIILYLQSGKNYLGSSAGTLVAAPRIDLVASTDDPSKAPNVNASEGLGLVNFIPLVHFDSPSYWPAFRSSFERAIEEGATVIPIRNDQFILVEGDMMKVITT